MGRAEFTQPTALTNPDLTHRFAVGGDRSHPIQPHMTSGVPMDPEARAARMAAIEARDRGAVTSVPEADQPYHTTRAHSGHLAVRTA